MTTSPANDAVADALEADLYADLFERFGPLIGGEDLRQLLGFKTADALRKACDRRTLELPVFMLGGRRSHFALTREVARIIAAARRSAGMPYVSMQMPKVQAPAPKGDPAPVRHRES